MDPMQFLHLHRVIESRGDEHAVQHRLEHTFARRAERRAARAERWRRTSRTS